MNETPTKTLLLSSEPQTEKRLRSTALDKRYLFALLFWEPTPPQQNW